VTTRRVVIGTLVAAALVLSLGRWASEQYTDSLWYAALGASDIWRARFVDEMGMRVGSFLVATAFAFVNFYAVRQSVVSLVLPRRIANIEIGEEVPNRYLLLVTLALSAAIGVVLTMPGDMWSTALLARIGRPFNESDPEFGADLGFFVYWLPFESALYYWAMLLLLVVIGVVILLYALTPSLRWTRGALYVSAYVRRHFTMLGGMLLLGLAWSYRLGMYRLLAEGSGPGATFTSLDHRVTVPATLVLALITLCAAVVVLWAGWSGQMRLAFFSVSAVLLLSLVARTVAPLLARRSDDPDATDRQERPYQGTRLSYTRRAYGIVERMRAETLGVGFHSAAELSGHTAVWDANMLRRFAERERHVSVVGTGAAWSASSSGLSALLVERGEGAASDGRELWSLGRFDAAAADERGQPVRAPASSRFGDETVIPEPAVYDSAPAYSLHSDSLQRFAGVEMVTTRSRLAHAWSRQNFRLLFGDLPLDRPMILERRDVRERVRALAPFFVQGSEILPVVADDSLYWALELYAASDDYPLAERFHFLGAQRGYFQHAATALLHARVVVCGSCSPRCPSRSPPRGRRTFPALRARWRAVARAAGRAAAHRRRRPGPAPGIRAGGLSRRQPRGAAPSVARRGRFGDLARAAARGGPGRRPRGTVDAARWAGSRPWNGRRRRRRDARDDLDSRRPRRGALERHRGAPAHGRLVGGRGPRSRAGSHASARGQATLPAAAFRWRAGATPALARVATVAGDTLRAGPTLAAALGLAAREPGMPVATPADLRSRASALYTEMREAMRRGDWSAFGRALDALGAALRAPAP
jgi:membrane protein implicated in regulation of membrane protease activity